MLKRVSSVLATSATSHRLLCSLPVKGESFVKRKSNSNKDLILSILKLTTTKRETNTYLSRYSTFKSHTPTSSFPFRIVIFKIKGNLLDYPLGELKQFNKTLDYIKKLGASPILAIDPDFLADRTEFTFAEIEKTLFNQYAHLSKCLEYNGLKLSPLRCILSKEDGIRMDMPRSLLDPLQQDQIPVLFPYLFDKTTAEEHLMTSTNFLKHFVRSLYETGFEENSIELTVEKIVYLDKLGGPPSIERGNNSHVFINLNQEYDRIMSELNIGHLSLYEKESHIENLDSMKQVLSSYDSKDLTGIITTLMIANENLNLNPIIYNILTGRSLVSSSLPLSKFRNKQSIREKISKTTVIRKGLEIKILKSLDELNVTKFKALIDESFKKSLNLDHYFNRIRANLSTIIIVGDYDGIAIITNEISISTGVKAPYLDKFAIARRAQGSLSVADIIFNILKTEYKDLLLWRSKKINPVNNWYFQRSNGSLDLKESIFRIFWNCKSIDKTTLDGFVEIGKSIQPSWDGEL